ncbi:amino acid ABC transporter substrate-binding protein [Caulobacter sp. FWC2]|uniref:amino acid ABC transporter substrate-binding protein n=1 Tax=Caulobacter sp. FWC2 TaxID=69664 RepID=UPI001E2BB246|nr:amino acid ABC transporter substrate-binding protein [Caulobacter sp. FWC2]
MRFGVVVLSLLALAACGQRTATPEPKPAETAAPMAIKPAAPSKTLKAVKARGELRCGVNPELPGFAFQDNGGRWRGFNVDFCRALAATVLGMPDKVTFVPLGNEERITALRTGKVDVLWRNTSWTFSRDVGDQLDMAAISYFDGQGFLVRRNLNLTSAVELNTAKICVQTGATSAQNLEDFFRARGIAYTAMVFDSEEQARAAYQADKCDAFTADISALAAARSVLDDPGAHVILPDAISKEPLGPLVRQDDPAWTDIVRWTLYALVLAEEHGVTKANAKDMKAGADPEARRLLGEGGFGAMLGLDPDWATRAIAAGGNYGEIFDRDIGGGSALKLDRGLNALWNAPKPGLLYAPPMR